MSVTAALLIASVFLVACAAGPPAEADMALPTVPPLMSTSPPPVDAPPSPSTAQHMISLARNDLARRAAVLPADISVDSVQPVTWSDASLGCPQPGVLYAQVTVPGYLIVLVAGGLPHNYHADTVSQVVYCQAGLIAAPAVTPPRPGEIKDDQPWMPVY